MALRRRTRLFELAELYCGFPNEAELARSLGVHQGTLWNIRNGKREIGNRFEALVVEWAATHLPSGISHADLFYWEQVPDPSPAEVATGMAS